MRGGSYCYQTTACAGSSHRKTDWQRNGKTIIKRRFIALILVSTFAAALIFSEKGIGTIFLSALIAETLAATAVGFSVAKLITIM